MDGGRDGWMDGLEGVDVVAFVEEMAVLCAHLLPAGRGLGSGAVGLDRVDPRVVVGEELFVLSLGAFPALPPYAGVAAAEDENP